MTDILINSSPHHPDATDFASGKARAQCHLLWKRQGASPPVLCSKLQRLPGGSRRSAYKKTTTLGLKQVALGASPPVLRHPAAAQIARGSQLALVKLQAFRDNAGLPPRNWLNPPIHRRMGDSGIGPVALRRKGYSPPLVVVGVWSRHGEIYWSQGTRQSSSEHVGL